MPLIKGSGKKAFSENVKKEMDAGKPQKQSLAIAFATKRRAAKKMAKGGDITANEERMTNVDEAKDSLDEAMMKQHEMSQDELDARKERMSGIDAARDEREMRMMKYARGGEIDLRDEKMSSIDDAMDDRELEMTDSKPLRHAGELTANEETIADILRSRKKYAEGGRVDIQENGDEDLNNEDQLSYEAARKKTYYDDSQLDDQPMDSNEHSDDIEKDVHDMVSKIRSKIRSMRS